MKKHTYTYHADFSETVAALLIARVTGCCDVSVDDIIYKQTAPGADGGVGGGVCECVCVCVCVWGGGGVSLGPDGICVSHLRHQP